MGCCGDTMAPAWSRFGGTTGAAGDAFGHHEACMGSLSFTDAVGVGEQFSFTRPCGLMDKALVFGTKDCRFESCQGHFWMAIFEGSEDCKTSRVADTTSRSRALKHCCLPRGAIATDPR